MKKSTPPRPAAGPELAAGVRPGAGVFGLARADTASKTPPRETEESDPTSEGRLLVGEGIHVKGEIESCHTLIVEGRVEASMDARELNVRRGGVYNGTAAVKSASIDGTFDGELTVEGLLTIKAGGRVGGKLRYRELAIEQGGRVSGDIDLLGESGEPAREVPSAARETSEENLFEEAIAR